MAAWTDAKGNSRSRWRGANWIAWLAYFNGGIRVLDLSNPYEMKELGYYIPKANERFHPTAMGQPTVIQINDVDIDARGLAYASDRIGTGSFILEYQKTTRRITIGDSDALAARRGRPTI